MISPPARAYLDAASSEPLRPSARDAFLAALDAGWADPLRLHSEARQARMLWENARAAVAEVLGTRPEDVSFTDSGTRAVELGLTGLLRGRERYSTRLVTSAVEHSSVLEVAARHQADGATTTSVGVDREGLLDVAQLVAAVGEPTAVVAVQAANLESGTVQDTDAVAQVCAAAGVPWFCDLAAALGRTRIASGWSVAAASAHKWGGPAGVGVLAIRPTARWRHPTSASERVDARVAGFENVPAVLAAAAALQEIHGGRTERDARQRRLTERIRREVAAVVPDVEVIGPEEWRLPHVASMSFLYVDGEALVTELDRLGFAVASGSACTASSLEPSHVLAAMGVLTHGNVRISLPVDVEEADVDGLIAALPGVVGDLRARLEM